jgi:hypothetical protein
VREESNVSEHDEVEYVDHEVGCCNEPHDEPRTRDDSWQCPTTNDWYVYCQWCMGWTTIYHGDDYCEFRGELLCEDCYYGNTTSCDGCGERFLDESVIWNERDDCYYCESCYEDRRPKPPRRYRCSVCGTVPTHLHAFSEDYLCDHMAARVKVAGNPVELAHVLPQAIWDEAVSWADTTGVKRRMVAR